MASDLDVGSRTPLLAGLEALPSDRDSGDRRALASRRVPLILEAYLQGQNMRQKEDRETSSRFRAVNCCRRARFSRSKL